MNPNRSLEKIRFGHSRRACHKVLCHTVHLWANLSRHSRAKCPWAQAYYQKKRDEGQSHSCALRRLGQRWLKILWKNNVPLRGWQTHERYDPELHQRNQLEPGSWVIGLMPAQNA